MPEELLGPLPPPVILALGARERTREMLRRSFPRRRGRLSLVRTADELREAMRSTLVDAVIVDLAQAADEQWAAAALARDFPSVPFFALAPLRPADLPGLVRACAEFEFADYLVEGIDDAVQREVLLPATFTVRFATALRHGDERLGLRAPLQRDVWRLVISHGGRTVRTEAIAQAVNLTREHLSRRFSAGGAPNLKRVIDLSRLLAASELAKNPGYDLPDIARVLGFASASHLSASCQRVIGVKSASLARLRPNDLIERFVKQGRSRSRQPVARS
jgi:AraC-like DNA-binding protein